MNTEMTANQPPISPRKTMSKTIAVALPQSTTLLGRLLAMIDRALMASAKASIRNGDLPYFGL
jgi:hypothetical protein